MRYGDLLRLEGWCSTVLGLALLAGGLAYTDQVWLLVAVAAGASFGVALLGGLRAPGRWFTERPLKNLTQDGRAVEARPLTQRLFVETAIWVVAVGAWLVISDGSSAEVIGGTGVASAVFGLAQAVPARRRVLHEEERLGRPIVVARRPALGSPDVAHP